MGYMKKPLTEEAMDAMRINLSVQDRRLSTEPVCDFCGSNNPVWAYAADRMSTGEARRCWRWLACPVCSGLIDEDHWDLVVSRAAHRLNQMTGGTIPMSDLRIAASGSVRTFLEDVTREL